MARKDAAPAPHPVFIGVAWPYANGPLHLGHVAGSLLPPDIFRRYMRMAGHPVLMVSGSDCHGTPIMIKAEKEGKTPAELVAFYHDDHKRALERLRIGFDLFTTTTTPNHKRWVQHIFQDALDGGFVETRTEKAPYDPKAKRFLPDRYVEGTCPHCGRSDARGDQCDGCGKTLDPQDLKGAHSKLNPGTPIEFRDTKHFVFLLPKLQSRLERYVRETAGHWRANTVNFTAAWLKEGLKDRAITRDLTWGIEIPVKGYDDKRIYVWFEAVCGYLTAAVEWAERSGKPDAWKGFWTDPACRSYYFLGKDNIPFHTIIWPAILLAENDARARRKEPPLNLPYDVPANEFLKLDGQQFSKSRGVSIAVHDVLDRFEADAVRYYLSINMPEGKDADWTWDDFQSKVNDELVGTLGNLVNRILAFTHKNLGAIPAEPPADDPFDRKVREAIAACGDEMALHLGAVRLRPAVRRLMEFASTANGWVQSESPWTLLKQDRRRGERALHSLLRAVKSLAVHMAPFLPDAAEKTWRMLGEKGSVHDQPWSAAREGLTAGRALPETQPLFRKLEPKDIPGAVPAPAAPLQPAAAPSPATGSDGQVSIEEFGRLEIRLALIVAVEPHPKADKLYVLRLDAGPLGSRQVVAGLKGHYRPEDLVGRTV
ncbi:MAG TPA: methionine--tRNA ligase, partial [Candidatus Thermoplasmatota archaeon]|nr:methionine--tRNA ligase [Candidatus Thermoplasmatota archaeon]